MPRYAASFRRFTSRRVWTVMRSSRRSCASGRPANVIRDGRDRGFEGWDGGEVELADRCDPVDPSAAAHRD
jgi:hypothetical protein